MHGTIVCAHAHSLAIKQYISLRIATYIVNANRYFIPHNQNVLENTTLDFAHFLAYQK